MPVSPEDCRKYNEELNKIELEELQKYVDEYLLSKYNGEGSVVVYSKKHYNKDVQSKFISNYLNVGWSKVEFSILFNHREDGFNIQCITMYE